MLTKSALNSVLKIEVYSKLSTKKLLFDSLIKGGGIFFLLFFLRPFGISDNDFKFFLFSILAYSFSVAMVYALGNLTFKNRFIKTGWVIGNELIFSVYVVIFSSIFNYFVSVFLLNDFLFTIDEYFRMLFYNFILIAMMVVAWLAAVLVFHYHKESVTIKVKYDYLKEIEGIYQSVLEKNDDMISFNIEKQQLNISKSKLVLVSSLGNYVRLYVLNTNKQLVQIIKRDTLKNVENQLSLHHEFFRCHRTQIVNLHYVKSVKGTMKNASIDLFDLNIPVSRQHFKMLKELQAKLSFSQT